MHLSSCGKDNAKGFSLAEVMVSIAVLAVAVPLAFAAMSRAGSADAAARVDSLSPAITRACIDKFQARGKEAAQRPDSDPAFIVMGFSMTGEPLGEIDPESYRSGCRQDGVTYLARIEAGAFEGPARPSRKLRIVIEYPAAAGEGRRERLEYITALPI
jgi:prepilin-type N-terminal cleavage/methylation domain-containing protein